MKKNAIYLMAPLLFLVFNACSNDSEDDLTDQMQNQDPITYSDDVKTIIDNNCLNCHQSPPVNGANTSLLIYENVRSGVENNNLINRISAQAGQSGAMPLGGPRLPQSSIDIIVQWQTDGYIE